MYSLQRFNLEINNKIFFTEHVRIESQIEMKQKKRIGDIHLQCTFRQQNQDESAPPEPFIRWPF